MQNPQLPELKRQILNTKLQERYVRWLASKLRNEIPNRRKMLFDDTLMPFPGSVKERQDFEATEAQRESLYSRAADALEDSIIGINDEQELENILIMLAAQFEEGDFNDDETSIAVEELLSQTVFTRIRELHEQNRGRYFQLLQESLGVTLEQMDQEAKAAGVRLAETARAFDQWFGGFLPRLAQESNEALQRMNIPIEDIVAAGEEAPAVDDYANYLIDLYKSQADSPDKDVELGYFENIVNRVLKDLLQEFRDRYNIRGDDSLLRY